MEEKKLQISFESNAFTKVGLFYVFSKYCLPVIVYGILSVVSIFIAINFVSYLFNNQPTLFSDINNIFNTGESNNVLLDSWDSSLE